MRIILTAVMVINLSVSLCAQADSASSPAAFESQMAADPKGLTVPPPQDPAPVGQGATAPGPGQNEINLMAIWQKPPEIVCQLTGPGSFNDSGTGSQVKGVDLGSMFEHKGRMYFVFGDTNIYDPVPSNHLSNILAYTTDKDASDCISLHYITMRDLFKDPADFYAKESVLQAEVEEKESYDISPDISGDYEAHYAWANAAGTEALAPMLLKKAAAIYDYYDAIKESREDLADYYAKLSVRLANFGMSFADDITMPTSRNSPNYQQHYEWALTAPMDELNSETAVRYRVLFDAVEQDKVKQIITSKTFPEEYTDIPTYGISIDGRIYIYIMSIRSWSPWSSNFAALAYSDDDGKTFTRIDNFFPANTNFMQVSLINRDGYLYLFGIPSGRYGGVKLARVPEDQVLDKSAYKFYKNTNGSVSWVNNEFDASFVVHGPVGELSVQWNPFRNAWIMTYLNERSRLIEGRFSPTLEGPWSGSDFLSGSHEVSPIGGWGYYGPYIHPTYTENNGQVMYYLLSLWSHYNVILMKTTLAGPYAAGTPVKVPYALPSVD